MKRIRPKIASKRKPAQNIGRLIGRCILGVFLCFVLLSVGIVLLYKYVPVRVTPLMVMRKTESWKDDRSLSIRKTWIPIESISPTMIRAVIASEDNLFTEHNGFSKQGLRQALQERLENGKVRHGGSTISQQTAKNVFCTHRKTVLRKVFEGYFTLLIEWIWGKERIMEVYLNVAEMGDGIFGIEAASCYYFGHSADRLNKSESALIAVCLPNPRKLHVDCPSAYVLRRQRQIMDLMPKLGWRGDLYAGKPLKQR